MCGIAGYISEITNKQILYNMISQLDHRGPDDTGSWIDEECGIALGHKRLSIIDLSPEGHQPMRSVSGRYVLVYNGEIYNYESIKKELLLQKGSFSFRGNSDTEVILAAFDTWGIDEALRKFVGMFAMALWDKKEQLLYLIRDRLGEKPLYYGWLNNNTFAFASELKALRAHDYFQADINRDALALFMRHNYIPAPYSIYENIFKVNPGSLVILNFRNHKITEEKYWSPKSHIVQDSSPLSDDEAVESLKNLLNQSVKQQMLSADVPVGAFLSGGIDSSTIVALMQANSVQPIKTFTIGFKEQAYNEAEHARKIANYLGTDHTELYVTEKDALNVIPTLPQIYDEPFADSSQIPTVLVSKLAKSKVTVTLSGDGGDELFGGYTRYPLAQRLWNNISRVPRSVRGIGARVMQGVPTKGVEKLTALFLNKPITKERLDSISHLLTVPDREVMYRMLVSHWKKPEEITLSSKDINLTFSSSTVQLQGYLEWMMYIDLITYLPDDILVKVDRAGMAMGLESRVPLLDHRIVEFALKLPNSIKLKNNIGKWPLRQVLYQYIPKQMMDRPKMGFGVPISAWLKTELREWAEDLLSEKRLSEEGYFNAGIIRETWKDHLSGKRNAHGKLWNVLMFQSWMDTLNKN